MIIIKYKKPENLFYPIFLLIMAIVISFVFVNLYKKFFYLIPIFEGFLGCTLGTVLTWFFLYAYLFKNHYEKNDK